MRATHNQFEDYNQNPPSEEEHTARAEEIERTHEAARLRSEPSEPPRPALPVFQLPTRTQIIPAPPQTPTIPGEKASKLTSHQLRSTLLSMHATADRDQQRSERQRAQIAPAPEYHEPARCTAPGCRRLAVVDEGAAPHCGAHQAPVPPAVEEARRRQAEANERHDASKAAELSELDRAVEALIRAHHLGPVLDAAWAASARISPWKSRQQGA
jgi:hypothetical protein